MSMSVFLVPLAIALCATASETISDIVDKCRNSNHYEPIQTKFNDHDLLVKTLEEHGLNVAVYGNNKIAVTSGAGRLIYERDNANLPYSIDLKDVSNIDCLANDLSELENEYDRNVQSFTYNKVLKNLPSDMTIIEDEVLEDESILLTISVSD